MNLFEMVFAVLLGVLFILVGILVVGTLRGTRYDL